MLTLIFMFALPILLSSYYNAERATSTRKALQEQQLLRLNERLSIAPVDVNSELAQRAGWIPGVWINNTGTVPVTLDKLYLVDIRNDTIYAVIDLKTARPETSRLISKMLLDVDPTGGASKPLPPAGTPITLQPGENLLVVFNSTLILPVANFLVARVESSTGILHPLMGAGAGGQQTLLGLRGFNPSEVSKGLWRGIFAPQSGFILVGYDDIVRFSNIWGERPCFHYYYNNFSLHGWAYDNDPLIPPYYRVEFWKWKSGWTHVVLRGFLGTFDTDESNSIDIIVDGWYVGDPNKPCIEKYTKPSRLERFVTKGDMDRNGVPELVFYTYWIHYYGGSDRNPDADFDGDPWSDSLALNVQVARDISGVDFIKISTKIIYDIAISGDGEPQIPLKIFSLAVWKYDPDTGTWKLFSTKDFDFIANGPKTFVVSATFPVHRNETYRVGVILYDPYKSIKTGAYYEFMMGLEHLIVEYGVLNPLFKESPPLYIVAIPDPSLIGGIGEEDYAKAKNITDLNEAKVAALNDFLYKLKSELSYAGVAGYTVIDTPQKLCDLLFSKEKPKYAVVYWLQGNVSIGDVTSAGGCSVSDEELADIIEAQHWVWVAPYGEPFGDPTKLYNVYTYYQAELVKGPFNMSITEAGISARRDAYAFYLYNNVNFTMGVEVYSDTVLIPNATFYYANVSSTLYYGTAALWVHGNPGGGVVIVNPVHLDWDATGDGALPETVVQQIVYSSLRAWEILRYSQG